YLGKILRIDLTNQKVKEEKINPKDAEMFIGGQGLGTKYLYDELPADVKAFDPENKLIFMTGPLTGVVSSKFEVLARSPLSKFLGDANSGGFWGPELRFAGYDGLILEGAVPEPKKKNSVYITIFDNDIEIRNAKQAKIWGKSIDKTVKQIKKIHNDPKIRIAAIGTAGENLVRYANIMTDYRAAGRCGLGAVMGSKGIKAVAVRAINKHSIPIAENEKLLKKISDLNEATTKDVSVMGFSMAGTPVNVIVSHSVGDLPIKYWTKGTFNIKNIDGQAISAVNIKAPTCYACPIHCHRYIKLDSINYVGKGPEYETIAAFGSLLMNDQLEPIVEANKMCNDLGMDTISCGSCIGFAMEAFEKGIITEEEVGMDLSWGNGESITKMVDKIAKRDGFGDVLAEGVMKAAEKIGKGAEEFAQHVKGMEIPMHDPRSLQGMGLHYATEASGARHSNAHLVITFEMPSIPSPQIGLKKAIKRDVTEGKAEVVKTVQDYQAIVASYVVCGFASVGVAINDHLEAFNAVIGKTYTIDDILLIGERITNIRRALNVKLGATASDDILPKRMTAEPVQDGASAGFVNRLNEMLPKYYEIRDWDAESGKPSKAKLESLGLKKIAKDLWG
ncbi:MAG: aldehyde ferredoxin oxidoreductase family protein, partial [Candidatus Hodarchaeota archaeon]